MKITYEKLGEQHESSIHILELKKEEGYRPLHYHPELELTFLTRGSGKRFVGDHIATFTDGDLVLLGGDLPHCWIHQSQLDGVVIQFDKKIFGSDFFQLREMYGIRKLLAQAQKGIFFDCPPKELQNRILNLIRLHDPLERLTHLFLLLNELANHDRRQELSQMNYEKQMDGKSKHRLDHALNYIYQNLNSEISLTEAAEQLHMSVSAFCHFFKKASGKSFTEFVNQIRIGYACRLIIETEKNIAQIAYESGYNSLSHFNQQFKKIKKQNPKAFRAHYRSGATPTP